MSYLTDRKRAEGLGASGTGTGHHWHMILTSSGLVVLVPLFLFTFGRVIGAPHDAVIAYYSRPFPAIVAALTFAVGFVHYRMGVQVAIEDYVGGLARKVTIVVMACLCYAAAAAGLFAVARMAL